MRPVPQPRARPSAAPASSRRWPPPRPPPLTAAPWPDRPQIDRIAIQMPHICSGIGYADVMSTEAPGYVGSGHYCYANVTAMLLASAGEQVAPALIEVL